MFLGIQLSHQFLRLMKNLEITKDRPVIYITGGSLDLTVLIFILKNFRTAVREIYHYSSSW